MIAKKSRQEAPDLKCFRSQVSFRQGIIAGLLGLANATVIVPNDVPAIPNSHISYTNIGSWTLPITEHHMVKIPKRKACVYCGGAKVWGPPI